MNDTLRDVLSRLDAVQEVRKGWKARCPAHDDSTPSLLVSEGDIHPVLLHCFAGCLTEDIARALGLDWQDLCADDSGLSERIKAKEARAPKPRRDLSDEEWDRRAHLYFQMTPGELTLLDLYRRRRIDAQERRDREWFDKWCAKEKVLFDVVEQRVKEGAA